MARPHVSPSRPSTSKPARSCAAALSRAGTAPPTLASRAAGVNPAEAPRHPWGGADGCDVGGLNPPA
eukprot:1867231-Pyramimonas_sp.AAC.1